MVQNLVVLTLDAVRKDCVGVYGSTRGITPNIDSLAKKSMVFENCFSISNTSAPSHASILSGCYPMTHGVRRNGWKVTDQPLFISEILRRNGFKTCGAVSQEMLSSPYNFNKGFDTFFDNSNWDKTMAKLSKVGTPRLNARKIIQFMKIKNTHSRAGKKTLQNVIQWIEKNKEEKFFVFGHFFDAHRDTYTEENKENKLNVTERYHKNIEIVDGLVGEIVNHLKKLNIFDNTIIILMADHGECLEELKKKSHGYTLLDVEMHVPLIIYHPKIKGKKVRDFCRTIDVVPTILELLRIEQKTPMEGVSLVSTLKEEKDLIQEVFMEGCLTYLDIKGVRTKKWKYILKDNKEGALYDMQKDPAEKKDITEEYLAIKNKLDEKLRDHFSKKSETQETDEHTKEMLRKLGYLEKEKKDV